MTDGAGFLRRELGPLPRRMRHLPRHHGYPVPYVVAWVDGAPDVRIVDPERLAACVRVARCWRCGETLGRWVTYVGGPRCAVHRISSEPPSHTACAAFAARACPFLTRPRAERREGTLPSGLSAPAGVSIHREVSARLHDLS